MLALALWMPVQAADALPYYDSAEFTPQWIDPNASELTGFHAIPSFRFTNQDGQTITEKTFEGKVYVANFFFSTCPGICPGIRSKLSRVQKAFVDNDDVRILSHSIRPKTDTVDILKKYAKTHSVRSGKWDLVTGKQSAIYRLAKSAYFANEDLGDLVNTKDFLHTENLLLIDKDRRIRGVYNGLNAASVSHLIADIKTLLTY